ncbi:MAG: DUF2892 domain-containing protein [Epsilonproteobacteria bacterium]|nr:DUF2892 domain-containing protein [Campylobacterota bacterium]
MKCNIGKIDKMLRIIIGLVLIATGIYLQNYIIAAIGAIPLLTALTHFCPLYTLLGLNTGCQSKEH